MTKLIGICPRTDTDDSKTLFVHKSYMDLVVQSNNIPILLPLGKNKEQVKKILNKIEGLIVPGGKDFDSAYYNQINITSEQFCKTMDESDYLYISEALTIDLPILGICRGMQFINVILGGTLYQDNKLYLNLDVDHQTDSHLVRTIASTDIKIDNQFIVNSYHHQSVDKLGQNLKIISCSIDEVPEIIIANTKKVVGVQFHIEKDLTNPNYLAIFNYFLEMIE